MNDQLNIRIGFRQGGDTVIVGIFIDEFSDQPLEFPCTAENLCELTMPMRDRITKAAVELMYACFNIDNGETVIVSTAKGSVVTGVDAPVVSVSTTKKGT